MKRIDHAGEPKKSDAELVSEAGVTTIEYLLVVAFMASISIFATIWLVSVLENMVALLAIKVALFLTGFP